jgi:fucose permease
MTSSLAMQRVIATTVATAAQPIGVAIGFVFPSIFVKAADAEPGQTNVDNARYHIYQSQLWQAIVGVSVLVVLLIFFREKPKTPPSSSSETLQRENMRENTKTIMKNKNF